MSDVGEKWDRTTIKGVAVAIVGGGTPSREVPQYWGGGIPWVTPGELTGLQDKYLSETADTITNAGLASSGARLIPENSLLVTTRATLGLVALTKGPMTTNQGFKSIVFSGRAHPDFYYHLLATLKREMVRRASGTTFLEVSGSQFGQIEVPLPPLGEQRRIAGILDALDDQIRLTTSIISKLQLAQAGLLADLLTGDGGKVEGAHHPTDLPNGWEVATCRDLCMTITVGIVVRPSQYYRDVGVPMLRSANVRAEGLVLKDLKYMDPGDHARMTKTSVRPGDLVTVRTGYPGTTAVIPTELTEANCIDIIISRPGSRVLSEYLAIWINSEFGKGQVLRSQGGLAQQHFNVAEMQSLRVALPPLARQRDIVDTWSSYGARVRLEKRRLSKLQLLKDGLVSDLFTGHVCPSAGGA